VRKWWIDNKCTTVPDMASRVRRGASCLSDAVGGTTTLRYPDDAEAHFDKIHKALAVCVETNHFFRTGQRVSNVA
jgi:hypothetical protein